MSSGLECIAQCFLLLLLLFSFLSVSPLPNPLSPGVICAFLSAWMMTVTILSLETHKSSRSQTKEGP